MPNKMDLKCEWCGAELTENPDYSRDNNRQPVFICTDNECDKVNRQVN